MRVIVVRKRFVGAELGSHVVQDFVVFSFVWESFVVGKM
jgi:hypothetical protein